MPAVLDIPAAPLPTAPPAALPAPLRAAAVGVSTSQRFVQLQAGMLAHQTLHAAAVQLVSDLALHYRCERVSLGLLDHQRMTLVALSGSGEDNLRRVEFDDLRAALEEAVDQDCVLRLPEPADAPPRVLVASALLLVRGVDGVLSVPLHAHGQCLGAVAFEWRDGAMPADLDDAGLAALLQLCAPLLALLRQNGQPLHRRAAQQLRAALARSSTARLAALAGAAGLLLAALALPVAQRVGGQARVEGAVERGLSAPANGYLKAVHVRPGDTVKAGQLLAELAEQDLEVDRHRLLGEVARHESAYMAAISRSDHAQMGVALARMEEAKAQLELAARQIGRTRIEAPFDGVLIAGDLSRSVGAPVKRGDVLLTVSPSTGWRIVVEVDEADIGRVQPGQPGQLALAALPMDSLPILVQRITPVARVVDGANVFDVEATLAAPRADLRPGLRGAARLTVGQQPLAWPALRALWSRARLALWRQGF